MPGMGPPPKPADARRRRNATVSMTKLPVEGRQGEPPPWPLARDVRRHTTLTRLRQQIEDLDGEITDSIGRAAGAAKRRQATLQERAEVLAAELEAAEEQERLLWAELWSTPQAVAWERMRWTRDVAVYVRCTIASEVMGDGEAAREARQWSDRLGLNPMAMLRLRWEIVGDEVGEVRSARAVGQRSTPAAGRARRGLKAVDGKGG